MTVINIWEIKKEWVFFLRNQDIFTTTLRQVTTDSDTGTFTADTEYLIDFTNVKNVRSVVVASVALTYGTDYTVNPDFDDGGTIKCKIEFTNPQTGAYTITYDYGPDRIFPDFPREALAISSFPRIGSDIISAPSELYSFNGDQLATVNITTNVYADNIQQINDYITAISQAVKDNQKNFVFIGPFVRKVSVGPILKIPAEISLDKIFQQNIDIQGILNFER